MKNNSKGDVTVIKSQEIRHAIICSLADGSEYIYKSYADPKQLNRGVKRFKTRFYKPKFRIGKIKITVEEVK